ncbi:MAG TPA: OmpA family protein [Hyphomicrobium sp.]|nr:OmpA family protein [Hyphomicrobium sp.]
MKHVIAIVLFAIVAGLAACEMASVEGIKSIPATVRKQLGLPEGGAVVAKIEASGIDAADFKAKVAHAVEDAKAKVADVAEKAVEAAQPDRSADVTPAPAESAPQQHAAADDIAPPSTPPGTTHFYGGSTDTAVAGWAAEAAMNPDYAAAVPATEDPVTEEPAGEQPAVESSTAVETMKPADDAGAAAQQEAAAPTEAPAAAVEEPAPVSLGGIGTTSYFGFADKPDADQPWAAAAAANSDYAAEPFSPSPPDEAATAEASDATDAPVSEAAPSEPAPQSAGPTGQTSFFGLAKMPDADQPWAAPASPNPNYSAEAVEAVTAPETGASADDAVSTEPAATSAEPSVTEAPSAADAPAPVSLGGVGATSYYGFADKPDADQPWAAAAKGNPDYTADVQAPTATAPATPQAVEACRDALNVEAQTGGLQFGLTRWDISPDNYGSLDRLAKLAKDCGGVVIEVRGHTDNTGRPQSNQTLSDLRAKAVVTYLTKAGVPLSKLKAIGFGEGKPIGDNATADGRRQNRRIEFVVTGN